MFGLVSRDGGEIEGIGSVYIAIFFPHSFTGSLNFFFFSFLSFRGGSVILFYHLILYSVGHWVTIVEVVLGVS